MSYLSWADGQWYVFAKSLGRHIARKGEETLAIWHIDNFDQYQSSQDPKKKADRYGYTVDYDSYAVNITYDEAKDFSFVIGKIKAKYRWNLRYSRGWSKLSAEEQAAKEEEYFSPVKDAVQKWIADIDKKWLDPHHRRDIIERQEKKKKLVLDRKAKAKYRDRKRRAVVLDV